MKALYRFFESVQLAIVLFLLIAVFSILSTLVPQGKTQEFYTGLYGSATALLIAGSGLSLYNQSLLFLIPMVLMVLNLGVCMFERLVRRAREHKPKRFGPDLIHAALLVLCVGSLVTAGKRTEQSFTMGSGDEVALQGGYRMSLVSFVSAAYPDGRPKSWTSTVDVTQDSKPVLSAYPIQVNHPLSLGFLNVYQSTYGTEALVQLQGADGKLTSAAVGQSLTVGESELVLAGTQKTEEGLAVRVEEWKNQQKVGSRLERAGDKLGPFNLVSVSEREVTGLNAVNDPGSLPVLLALLIGLSGFVLTAVQKKKGDSI